MLTPRSEVGTGVGAAGGALAVAPLIEFEADTESDADAKSDAKSESKGRISVTWAFSKKGIVLFCVSANCQPVSVLVLQVSITNQGDGFCVGNK
ncbi:hypothetical protein [uncultured Alteromonas sp.]|uniref:hypothetical protein n=1 Tax=uncultured Alteromonas sp. TaxID=179113 RepID=UPI00258CC6CA|nr:hypothetical protein [uncultured Alteromonas sp.]